jgi:Type VI secretion system/phage-baseplate injector OB domain
MTSAQRTDDQGTLGSLGYTESFLDGADAIDIGGGRRRYYGKFRGTVVSNVDPLSQGRLIVSVPDVKQLLPSTWALPCVPFTGTAMGTYVVPPPIGAGVWVEFEQGNPEHPIWVGCFWDEQPAPGQAGLLAQIASRTGPGTPMMSIEIPGAGIAVTSIPVPFGPVPGNVTLFVAPATSVSLSPAGVSITAPTVSITTPKFSVNEVQFVVV